jgi:hypothetical protein
VAQIALVGQAIRSRVLICGSTLETTAHAPAGCQKTFRLLGFAKRSFRRRADIEVDVLDLSLLTSEYGRNLFPPLTRLPVDHDAALSLALQLLSITVKTN